MYYFEVKESLNFLSDRFFVYFRASDVLIELSSVFSGMMKRLRHVYLPLVLSSTLLLACSLPTAPMRSVPVQFQARANQTKPAKWTVMVFIAGDNDLEEYVVKDIETELAAIGANPTVQVVALADRTPGYDKSRGDWTSTKLFHATKGIKATAQSAVADWGERNTGDPKTLLDFVSWSKANYPAERYALFMWGHGWNWHPGYIMEDKSNHDALDPHELKSILPQIGAFEMVAYDGCNMGSLEVEALWKGFSKTIVHSQEYVDWDGIEYDVVLKQLNQNPAMSADQLAVVTSRSASMNKERTGSAVALDQRFDRFLQMFDAWTLSLIQVLPLYRVPILQAFDQAQHFIDAPDEKDLLHLVNLIQSKVPDPVIQEQSEALESSFNKVLLTEWHLPEYPFAHGITISQVLSKDEYFSYYQGTELAQMTHWNELLAKLEQ